jgi:hypothetical protein
MPRLHIAAGVSALALVALLLTPAASRAYETATWGQRYVDQLDTREHALQMHYALGTAGYTNYHGEEASTGLALDYNTRLRQGVFFSGHAGYGRYMAGADGGKFENMFMAERLTLALPSSSWSTSPAATELDDVKFAIFAGCYTADEDPFAYSGNFMRVGASKGIDSVVGWTGANGAQVYGDIDRSHDGVSNYFWARAAIYFSRGHQFIDVMGLAKTDTFKRFGDDWGWGTHWRVAGAAAWPEYFRIKPAQPGQPNGYAERPGARASVANAPRTPADAVADDANIPLERLEERDEAGRLTYYREVASVEGIVGQSLAGLRERAAAFLDANASQVTGRPWSEVSAETVSPAPGYAIARFTFRPRIDNVPGPAVALLDLDRRTGRVVSFSLARAANVRATTFAVGRDEATDIARREAQPDLEIATVVPEIWDQPRWVVTLKGETPAGTVRQRLTIDATDGSVIGDGRSL